MKNSVNFGMTDFVTIYFKEGNPQSIVCARFLKLCSLPKKSNQTCQTLTLFVPSKKDPQIQKANSDASKMEVFCQFEVGRVSVDREETRNLQEFVPHPLKSLLDKRMWYCNVKKQVIKLESQQYSMLDHVSIC